MDKKPAEFRSCLQPTPKVLVSCRGNNGRDNALAVAYCCNCSFDPPMVMIGIVPSRYSYELIKESGCFVVNLPDKNNNNLFDYLGKHSGKNENKLEAIGASIQEAIMIDAPLLDDCPINIECRVVQSMRTGSHEMFAGEVLYVHAKTDILMEDNKINFENIEWL